MKKSENIVAENGKTKFEAPGDYSLIVWRVPGETKRKFNFELSQGERVLDCSVDSVTEKELCSVLAQYGLSVNMDN